MEANIDLPEGATKEVTLSFSKVSHVTPSAPPPALESALPALSQSTPDHSLAYVAFGVGGAALVTGGIFGGLALSQKSDLDGECPNRQCGPAFHSANDSYGTKKIVAGVGLIAGGALLGAGVVLYFTAPSPSGEQQARLGAFYDGQQLGLRGAF